MFEDLTSGSIYESLDQDTRLKVANLLQARVEVGELLSELNRRKIALLMHPTADGEQDVNDYAAHVVAPAQEATMRQALDLVEDAIDVEGLIELLPMVIMGVTRSINFPLLLTAIGLEPQQIQGVISKIKDLVEKGLG